MRKAEKTKKSIIEKSARLFNQKGYAGTSMQDIAKAVGVTKGSIYGNFKSKDEIALAVFAYNLQLLFGELWTSIDQETSAKAKLQTYVEFHRQHYQKILDYGGCPVLNCAIESDDTHPQMNKKVAHSLHSWETNLVQIFKLGIRQKEFKDDVDPTYFAGLIISLLEGSIMLAKTHKEASYILNSLSHIEYLIQGMDINS